MPAPTPLFEQEYTRSAGSSRSITLPAEATAGRLLVCVTAYRSTVAEGYWTADQAMTLHRQAIQPTGTNRARIQLWTRVVESGDTVISWSGASQTAYLTLRVFDAGCTVHESVVDNADSAETDFPITTTDPCYVLFAAARGNALTNPWWVSGVTNTFQGTSGGTQTQYADGDVEQGSAGTVTAVRTAGTFADVLVVGVALEEPAGGTELTVPTGNNATSAGIAPTLSSAAVVLSAPVGANATSAGIAANLSSDPVSLTVPVGDNADSAGVAPTLTGDAALTVPTGDNADSAGIEPTLSSAAVELSPPVGDNATSEGIAPSLSSDAITLSAPTGDNAESAGVTPTLSTGAEIAPPTGSNATAVGVAPSLSSEAISLSVPTGDNAESAGVAPTLDSATLLIVPPGDNADSAGVVPSLTSAAVNLVVPTSANAESTGVAPGLSSDPVTLSIPVGGNAESDGVAPTLSEAGAEVTLEVPAGPVVPTIGISAAEERSLAMIDRYLDLLARGQGYVAGVSVHQKDAAVGSPGYLTTSDGAISQTITANGNGSTTIRSATILWVPTGYTGGGRNRMNPAQSAMLTRVEESAATLTRGVGRFPGVTASQKDPATGSPGYRTSSDGAISQTITLESDGSVTLESD